MGALKTIAKLFVAGLAYYSGLLRIVARLGRFRNPIILMYHQVAADEDVHLHYIRPGMYTTRSVFERQMAFLSDRYHLISLQELVDALSQGRKLPPKSVVLTFDDGWRNVFDHAIPVLLNYRIPATVYLTTDLIGTNYEFWFTRVNRMLSQERWSLSQLADIRDKMLARYQGTDLETELVQLNICQAPQEIDAFIRKLKRLEHRIVDEIIELMQRATGDDSAPEERLTMTWEEAASAHRQGIHFGSHGKTHRLLTRIDLDEVRSELVESRTTLEEKLDGRIDSVAFPNGDYDEEILKLVAEAGYRSAVTTRPGTVTDSNMLELPRIGIHQGMTAGPAGRFSRALFTLTLIRGSIGTVSAD